MCLGERMLNSDEISLLTKNSTSKTINWKTLDNCGDRSGLFLNDNRYPTLKTNSHTISCLGLSWTSKAGAFPPLDSQMGHHCPDIECLVHIAPIIPQRNSNMKKCCWTLYGDSVLLLCNCTPTC